jgi:hypothetical protein
MGIDLVQANPFGRGGFHVGKHFLRGAGRVLRPSDVAFNRSALHDLAPNASPMPEGLGSTMSRKALSNNDSEMSGNHLLAQPRAVEQIRWLLLFAQLKNEQPEHRLSPG